MNVDEVIAQNVQRVRKARGLSVAQLAGRLSVGRHLVYDYERARPGTEQRQFLWSDLVRLCSALQVTLFSLVLPPEGEDVDMLGSAVQELFPIAADVTGDDARSRLGWMLFGVPAKYLHPKAMAAFAKLADEERSKMKDGINQLIGDQIEQIRRLLEEGKE